MKNQQTPEQQTPEQRTGERVRDRRTQLGLSQQLLADAMTGLGFSWRQTTVAKTEAAERPIRVNEVTALASILGLSTADMLDDRDTAGAAVAFREWLRAGKRLCEIRREIKECEQELETLREQEIEWDDRHARYSSEHDRLRGATNG